MSLERIAAPCQWEMRHDSVDTGGKSSQRASRPAAMRLAFPLVRQLDKRMSIWGMIIGGAAGAALGGPIGGLLGAAAGIAVERGFISPARPEAEDATRGVAFTVAVIALSAKMAKVDGNVTRDEIAAFRQRVQIAPDEIPQVGRFWDLARQTPDGFEGYASQVARMFAPRAPVLEQLLDLLFYIAGSDSKVTSPEIDYLARVSEIFGFTETDFQRMLAVHSGDVPPAWQVLGVEPDISDDDLRARWKALVRENHPDRLIADGMPAEFIAAANERLARINDAYDRVARSRGLIAGTS